MNAFRAIAALATLAIAAAFLGASPAASAPPSPHAHLDCQSRPTFCTEVHDSESVFGEDVYVGHDEPSLNFYSNAPGSGNSNVYRLRLPKDSKTPPNQAGTGGTSNFELHPAFWFGMALCDSQSYPLASGTCTPNSDTNIFDSASGPKYIGNHPGTAFMEMQFYPPSWVAWPPGNSCDPQKWCAALNIDSLSQKASNGQVLNASCQAQVGVEYVNFAFLTKSGVAHAAANPVNATLDTYTPNSATDLFMSSGDELVVDMHDTPAGFQVEIHDLTSGQNGSMTASVANQFGQVQFDPTGTSCNNIPYAFHPMYSTSSEHTRVPWAAHSYNVAFSDEIGHFELCQTTDCSTGPDADADDVGCFPGSVSTAANIGGCLGTDGDFDGVPYQKVWPGSLPSDATDHNRNRKEPEPILFTSPTFGPGRNFERVAFETDLPRIELSTTPACDRTTGANCVNPPVGASFYPIFTTTSHEWERAGAQCTWQLGGAFLPDTSRTFGGTSTAEYGPLLQLLYPTTGGGTSLRYNDFRNVLSSNPCRADGHDGGN